MDIVSSSDFMSFEEKDSFWRILFEKISKAVKNGYRYVVIGEFSQIVGRMPKNSEEDYTLTVDQDQYEIFLNNYIKWCEEQERFEDCILGKEILDLHNSGNNKKIKG